MSEFGLYHPGRGSVVTIANKVNPNHISDQTSYYSIYAISILGRFH